MAERRAAAARAAFTTQRTQHDRALLYNSSNSFRAHRNVPCNCPSGDCRAGHGCMSDAVFRRESAVEYFKELVDGAISHQRLAAQELTAYYVVQLLASFLQREVAAGADAQMPLAVRLGRALDGGGVHQRATLREIGDVSLFISGFFADSLTRKLVDVDYYISIGGCAYNALSRV